MGVFHEHAAVQQPLGDLAAGAVGGIDVDAGPQARDTDAGDPGAHEGLKRLLEVLAECLGTRLELSRGEHLDHLLPHGAGERVAPEGRPVLAGANHAQHRGVGHDRRQRHDAAAERLAEQVHIRHDLFTVARERRSDAGETRLDLVGDEEHILLVADLADAPQVPFGRDHDARLALDGLDQHRGGVLVDRAGDGLGIPVRHRHEAGRERPEARPRLRVVAEAHDRGRAPVEVAVGHDDRRGPLGHALHPVRPGARKLDARLDRLGAGVHRQHHVFAAEGRQGVRERAQPVVVERAARERDPTELVDRRRHQGGVSVPEVQGRVRRQQVEVALALDVGHPRALSARDDDGQRVVVVRDVRVLSGDQLAGECIGRGVGAGTGEPVDRRGGHRFPRSSSVQHLMPPPPSSSSDRSTSTGL